MKYLLLSIALLAGCGGPSSAIAANANKITTIAQSSKERFQVIEELAKTPVVDTKTIVNEAKRGAEEQEVIITTTKNTLVHLTNVEDKTPIWVSALDDFALIVGVLGMLYVFWYLGIGHIIRGLVLKISCFIPKEEKDKAAIARKVLASNDPAAVRELIAVMRVQDPAFDAAYKKSKEDK